MTPDQAQIFLDDNFAPWVLALQPRVTAIGPDETVLEIPIVPDIVRAGNIVSGQTLATLADTAMVLACGGHLGQMVPVATVTLDTQFLRPGSGERIVARAEVTRAGRAMIFARSRLVAEPAGKDVAHATATFAR